MGQAILTRSVLSAYGDMVKKSTLVQDEAQRAVVEELQQLADALEQADAGRKTALGGRLFWRGGRSEARDIKGLYIWGDVGRGKTLLMDLFFEHVRLEKKKRVHFHEFMDQLHISIGEFRQDTRRKKKHFDPIAAAVNAMVRDTKLLCFDEFHVNDITNAMLLGRLFEKLFEAGVVVVATSNVPPENLYHNGLNRQLFLPFIDLLKQQCAVLNLDARVDYRLEKLSRQPVFHFGSREEVAGALEEQWEVLSGGMASQKGVVKVLGRTIQVAEEAMGNARFSFDALCEAPLGTRDYLAISHVYHTLMIDYVPRFDRENSNAAKRFIQLIDTLYDRGIKLVAGFEVALEKMSADKDLAFEFKRTVSRLNEMASSQYLAGKMAGTHKDAQDK
ncbi:MAG TPA: cell division protein ZapE [Devosia sp.]|nr:cell division protein ZapE [Devosia sp.]